ncbi:MAG: hypothetical protein P9L99_00225 [Candidatus Lernaella stagnicola]|nr:hypothetical protein [Candidatus Lernaella stagnicola]
MAQEIHRQENNHYVDNLEELLKVDRGLTDDAQVTFVFGFVSESGFTFTTQHGKDKQKREVEFNYRDN